MPTYKALSVRQPYAYLLVTGIKTCENRSWTTHHRGTLVIHAGAKPMTKEDWERLDDIHKELGESLAWMISACQQVDEFLPLKGRLNRFDVDLPDDIRWAEDDFYPQAKR